MGIYIDYMNISNMEQHPGSAHRTRVSRDLVLHGCVGVQASLIICIYMEGNGLSDSIGGQPSASTANNEVQAASPPG